MRRIAVLTAALAASALLVPAASAAQPQAGPTVEQLLAAVKDCPEQVSTADYATDADAEADIPVCGKSGATYWKADMDIVCDGQETDVCNSSTDPDFYPGTAWSQSDGEPLIASELPFVVVPLPSDRWDPADSGIEREVGNVVAVIYQDKLVYGVVGDLGPEEIIGEGSYALAEALGVDPDPSSGGVDAKDVTYIALPGEKVDPIEDPSRATEVGERLASEFVAAK